MIDPTTGQEIPDQPVDLSKVDINSVKGEANIRAQQLGISENDARRLMSQFGEQEKASFAERSVLPTSGTPVGTSDSYWDAQRGVQVYAKPGEYFELYSGGGVKPIVGNLPAKDQVPNAKGNDTGSSSLFTQPTQGVPGSTTGQTQATPGLTNDQLAYQPIQGKTIETTGQTVFNPTTGVDEYAGQGEVLIKYTDGTVERRKIGGNPGSAVPIGQFGRTPQELGITENTGIKDESGKQLPMNQGPQGTGYENLKYLGASYDAQGKTRKAGEGNAYYQDPTSGTILERPDKGNLYKPEIAQKNQLAQKAAQSQKADSLLSSYGVNPSGASQAFQDNPIKAFADTYLQLQNQLGVGSIKTQIEDINKQTKELDDKYTSKIKSINDDPFLSEALRSKKVASETEKYNTDKGLLTARLQLQNSLLQDARQEAQFVSSNALQQYNADRQFQLEELKFEAQRADAKADAQYKQALLEIEKAKLLRPATSDLQEYTYATEQGYDGSFLDWQKLSANLKAKAAGTNTIGNTGYTSQQFQALNTIGDNLRQDQNIKDFAAVRAGYETAKSAAQTGNSAGDIVLMRMLAKVTDPTTGVREEEYRTFQGATGTLVNYGVQLTSGLVGKGQLTPEGRKTLLDQISNIYKQKEAAYQNSLSVYGKQAERVGGTLEDIFAPYLAPGTPSNPTQPSDADTAYVKSLPIPKANEVKGYTSDVNYAKPVTSKHLTEEKINTYGITPAESRIIMKESGGRVDADNPTSTAFGIWQGLISTRRKYAAMFGYDPETQSFSEQLNMMRAYIKDRYGTAEKALAFHNANNWY